MLQLLGWDSVPVFLLSITLSPLLLPDGIRFTEDRRHGFAMPKGKAPSHGTPKNEYSPVLNTILELSNVRYSAAPSLCSGRHLFSALLPSSPTGDLRVSREKALASPNPPQPGQSA